MLQNLAQYFIFPVIGGFGAVLIGRYSEDEKLRFTLRGFAVLFLLGAVVGGGLYAVSSHLLWVCNEKSCGYAWVTI